MYDLITITQRDLDQFVHKSKGGKIHMLLNLVLEDLPKSLKKRKDFIRIELQQIEGFEDKNVKGYEVLTVGDKDIGEFIQSYIPFFILKKEV
jgi:hypothetical protein